MNKPVEHLITQHLDIWTQATEAKSTAGRGTRGKINLLGIQKLRELILEMAVRGLLVPQDPNDEPASELLKKIAAEKAQLIKDGKIKKTKPLPGIADDEKPFELPKGWEWARLGEVGNVFNGNSINERIKNEKYTNVEGLPFIATKDVGYGFEPLNYDNGVKIPAGEPKFVVARSGAVLICAEGGSAGKKCGITDQDICFGNKLFVNEPFSSIDPKFILAIYLSPSFYEKFSEVMTGIIGGISRANFINLPLQLPPLAEQTRIVAKVDELMALCDQLENDTLNHIDTHQTLVETLLGNLVAPPVIARPQAAAISEPTEQDCIASLAMTEQTRFHQAWLLIEQNFDVLFTTEHSIDTLKQTILQLAVMGKLVPQNPNDEPASELLKKIAAEKAQLIKDGKIKKSKPLPEITKDEKPFDLPSSWELTKLSELMESERDISYGIIKLETEPVDGGIYVLRCSDVKHRWIDLVDCRKVTENVEEPYARTRLRGGEVLVNIRGTLGGVAVVPESLSGYNIAREVAMLPIHSEISPDFIMNLIAAPFFWKMIEGNLKGIAYKGLNLSTLREFIVPLPPLEEQTRIVAKVNQLMTLCDQIKAQFQTAQHTQAQLAQTITQQALS